jgi:HEAT repeat protein
MKKRTKLLPLVLAGMITQVAMATDESSALAVLASSESALHDKAMACDALGRTGTAKAVPVLAKLLADAKLHDYARDGLERIPDPAAGAALLEALKTLKADLRIGVIISLGDRREKAAVPALTAIAKGTGTDAKAARSALAQIASAEAAGKRGKAIGQ